MVVTPFLMLHGLFELPILRLVTHKNSNSDTTQGNGKVFFINMTMNMWIAIYTLKSDTFVKLYPHESLRC